MDIQKAILARRSIRRFKNAPVPRELIEHILALAVQSPSGKNLQPWRFIVVEGIKKDQLVDLMRKVVIELKGKGVDIGSFENTITAINQAPVIVFVFNALYNKNTGVNNYEWMVDLQSIGGAIQTMLLAAQSFGLGTLWICDSITQTRKYVLG